MHTHIQKNNNNINCVILPSFFTLIENFPAQEPNFFTLRHCMHQTPVEPNFCRPFSNNKVQDLTHSPVQNLTALEFNFTGTISV